jgi:hypothetical protein
VPSRLACGLGRVQRVVQLGAQLQAQALTQVARAHTRRLQAVQQTQCDGEVVHQVFHLLFVVTGQAAGQVFGKGSSR